MVPDCLDTEICHKEKGSLNIVLTIAIIYFFDNIMILQGLDIVIVQS